MSAADQRPEPTLADVLGGRGGAVDATVPVVVFVAAFVLGDALGWPSVVAWAGGAAVLAAVVVGVGRRAGGRRPRASLVGLLGVAVAALVAAYTVRAVDFFLVQIVTNAASALAWTVSIVVSWPLLCVVVGNPLGQR